MTNGSQYVQKRLNPLEAGAKLAKASYDFGSKLAGVYAVHIPVARLNAEGGLASEATTALGLGLGTQNMRYLYWEVDGGGNHHFLGGSNQKINDPKKLIFEQDKYLNQPELSDFVNTTQAIQAVSQGLVGHPEYDPLFNRWMRSIPSEQIKLYETYGQKEVIAEVGGDGPKHKIVCTDRANLVNAGISEFYWQVIRRARFGLITYPIVTNVADYIKKEGVSPIPIVEDLVRLDSAFDEPLTGIGYYPEGLNPVKSPSYQGLQQLEQKEKYLTGMLNTAIMAQSQQGIKSLQNDINKIRKRKEDIITSMGRYQDLTLSH